MTNKKLWLSLLVVVLVVCMLSVSLFACNKDKDTPAPSGPSIESQAIDAIINGIKESVATGDMKDLKVDGTIGITLGDKSYSLALALELDLLQFEGYNYEQASGTFDPNGEYFTKSGNNYTKVEKPTEANFNANKYYIRVSRAKVETIDKVTPSTQVTAELKEGNTTLLGLYYADGQPGDYDIYEGNILYVQTKTKKLAFPAPYISAVQSAKDGQVDFSGIDLTDEDTWGTLDTVTGIIGSLATNGVLTDKKASITLDIATLLDPNNDNNLLTLVSGLQDWLTALDLDIDASALGDILPSISLVLSADLNNGKATGFDITLTLKEKDIEIKNKSNKHTLLKIDMTKDIDVGLSLDYTIGGNPQFFWPSDIDSYTFQENVLDAKLSVDLFLKEGINVGFDLGNTKMTLEVPGGYYTLSAEIAADPFAIIKYINATNGIDFSSTPKMIDSIKLILQAINALDLKLTNTKDATGAAIAADKQEVLHLFVGNTYEDLGTGKYKLTKATDGSVEKKVTVKTTILKGKDLTLTGASVNEAIGLVNGFIDKSGDKGATYVVSAAEDETTKLLQTIGGYLLGAYIGINDGTHDGIFASFDSTATASKIIPFSGYTKWQGAYNEAYNYYTVNVEGGYDVADITAFAKDTTYYTKTEGQFVKVDQTKGFDEYVYYYTLSGNTYTRQDSLTKFAADTDYYVWQDEYYTKAEKYEQGKTYYTYRETTYSPATVTAASFEGTHPDYYVKGGTGAKEFGIGLSATLAINDGIEINAVVKNMDIFGLPGTITAKISNFQISFFNNDYPIYFTASTFGTYQQVAGKIQA